MTTTSLECLPAHQDFIDTFFREKIFCTLAQIQTVKQTLLFQNFEAMIAFSKELEHGYLHNTVNYTITGLIPEEKLAPVLQQGSARIISTTDKVFSYHQVS